MKKGDLIVQSRMPGGECLLIRIFQNAEEYDGKVEGWVEHDFPLYRVLHPEEGLIDDPSYYYQTRSERDKFEVRHLKYLIEKEGKEIPDWLRKEIEKNESR